MERVGLVIGSAAAGARRRVYVSALERSKSSSTRTSRPSSAEKPEANAFADSSVVFEPLRTSSTVLGLKPLAVTSDFGVTSFCFLNRSSFVMAAIKYGRTSALSSNKLRPLRNAAERLASQ